MFRMDGIDIEFSQEAVNAIAKKAIELKTGARGLRTIIEQKMTRLMYEAPSIKDIDKIIVTDQFIEFENVQPEIIKKHNNDQKQVC